MQQQELAQIRQREANLTALAAIGPRKKRKVDSPGATPSGTEVKITHLIGWLLYYWDNFVFDNMSLTFNIDENLSIYKHVYLYLQRVHFK